MRTRNWVFLLLLVGILVNVASAATVYSSWMSGSSGINTRVYSGSGTNNSSDWTNNGDGDNTSSNYWTGVSSLTGGDNPTVLLSWQGTASPHSSGVDTMQWDGSGWTSLNTAWSWSNAGAGNGYTGVGAGNLDNNGKLDALTTYKYSGGSTVAWKELDNGSWVSKGDISFFQRTTLTWTGVSVGNLDGDANPDILLSWQSDSGYSGVSTSEYVNGSWSGVTDLFDWNAGVGYGYTGVTFGDLDGDANVDILTTWKGSNGNSAINWKEYVSGSIVSRGDVAGSLWDVDSDPGRTGVTFAVPEPTTLGLLAAGGVLAVFRKRK